MAISSKTAWALGLGVLGVFGLVRQTTGFGDDGVQKASNSASSTAPAFRPAVIGSVDMEAVFKNYEKVKFHIEQLKAEGMAKQGDLVKIMTEGKQVAKEMEGFQPGSADYKLREGKLTDLQAKLEAEKAKAQREFDARHAEVLSTFYKEVQSMVSRVARYKGLNFVVKVSNEPVVGDNPDAVMMAMAKSVVYSDPTLDVTATVLHNLNKEYIEAGGKTVQKPASTGVGNGAGANPPSTNAPAPGASQGATPGGTSRPNPAGAGTGTSPATKGTSKGPR
jgi:outer membrane protein